MHATSHVIVLAHGPSVDQAMFGACCDGADVGCLQDLSDPVTADRAPAFVCMQYFGLEGLLAEPAVAATIRTRSIG
ncbi:hypothetical protein [Nonomuraea sp. NPDC049709]|uniref:hypothetical protein n=1 Tax=Nonomuraea sp. NPDC049709 TaxID=3154736 RepID=UPI003417B1D5